MSLVVGSFIKENFYMPVTITPVPVSGLSTSSGSFFTDTSGSVSGPFYVLTQSIRVLYARTPSNFITPLQGPSSLSATYAPSIVVGGTDLNYIVQATVSVSKVLASYATSSYQQPQKFTTLPDADKFGSTYGATSGTGILGPAGTIITSQPFIYRRPWVEGTDAESVTTIIGTNRMFINFGTDGTLLSFEGPGAQGNLVDFKQGVDPKFALSHIGIYDTRKNPYSWGPDYQLFGPYSTTQENFVNFTNFMDSLGDAITTSKLLKPNLVPTTDATGSFFTGITNVNSTAFTGISGYDKSRHSYT